MVAIKDLAIATRNYRKHKIKERIANDKCRICGDQNETIDHIITGCRVLAPMEYTRRHNNVGKAIHQEVLATLQIPTENFPYYKYEPKSVIEGEIFKLYWNRNIITDVRVPLNRPDMVLLDKTKYTKNIQKK